MDVVINVVLLLSASRQSSMNEPIADMAIKHLAKREGGRVILGNKKPSAIVCSLQTASHIFENILISYDD